jgi:hypothetical protein
VSAIQRELEIRLARVEALRELDVEVRSALATELMGALLAPRAAGHRSTVDDVPLASRRLRRD